MAVTAKRARELALALEGASETPHFERAAFRTPQRIFATLAADGRDLNLIFDLDLQEHYCEQAGEAFAPLPNAWGKQGATRCLLSKVDVATLRSALAAAHARANAPRPKPRRCSGPSKSQ